MASKIPPTCAICAATWIRSEASGVIIILISQCLNGLSDEGMLGDCECRDQLTNREMVRVLREQIVQPISELIEMVVVPRRRVRGRSKIKPVDHWRVSPS